jgi:hypothetical protein
MDKNRGKRGIMFTFLGKMFHEKRSFAGHKRTWENGVEKNANFLDMKWLRVDYNGCILL